MKTIVTDGDVTTCTDISATLRSQPGNYLTLTLTYYPNNQRCHQNVKVNVTVQTGDMEAAELLRDVLSVQSSTDLQQLHSSSTHHDRCVSDAVHVLPDGVAERRYRCQCDTVCSIQLTLDTTLWSAVQFSLCEIILFS